MVRSSIVAGLVVVGIAGCDRFGPGPLRDTDQPELAFAASRHRIEIVAADGPISIGSWYGRIQADRAGEDQLARYASLFESEFDLYPPELVRKSRLRRILLCSSLSFNLQPVAALPDFATGTLLLDVATDGNYAQRTLHHDFFHLLDYGHHRVIDKDPRWEVLNVSGFRYEGGGWKARENPCSGVPTDRFPGFLNQYSMSGVEEDKAEVFAYLMVEPAYVQERVRNDTVLRLKVARMKEMLAEISADVNETFWSRIGGVRREVAATDKTTGLKLTQPQRSENR